MTPNDPWYKVVAAESPLDQGDLILRCPILTWDRTKLVTVTKDGDEERLKEHIAAYKADVLVLTQACDLEHLKVRNVVLCPHRPVSEIHIAWQTRMQQIGQTPSIKAWRRYCEDIADGYVWNQVLTKSVLSFSSSSFSGMKFRLSKPIISGSFSVAMAIVAEKKSWQ